MNNLRSYYCIYPHLICYRIVMPHFYHLDLLPFSLSPFKPLFCSLFPLNSSIILEYLGCRNTRPISTTLALGFYSNSLRFFFNHTRVLCLLSILLSLHTYLFIYALFFFFFTQKCINWTINPSIHDSLG